MRESLLMTSAPNGFTAPFATSSLLTDDLDLSQLLHHIIQASYFMINLLSRSSTSQLLAIPRHNLSFGSFRVSAPKIWNSLTPQIRQFQTLATFRCHLKTHYFQSAFSAT